MGKKKSCEFFLYLKSLWKKKKIFKSSFKLINEQVN